MSVVAVITAYPIREHRAAVIAAFEKAISRVHAEPVSSCTRCTRETTGS
jgi:hypothetical protein